MLRYILLVAMVRKLRCKRNYIYTIIKVSHGTETETQNSGEPQMLPSELE